MALSRLTRPSEQESVGALVTRLSTDVTRIVRAEIALVQLRATAVLGVLRAAAGVLAAAAIIAIGGFGAVAAGLVMLLALRLPAWVAAFVVGGGLLLVAGILAAFEARVVTRGVNEALAPETELAREDTIHGG